MQRSAPVKVTAASSVHYLAGSVEWSVPTEERLKGSVWPAAGRLSFFNALYNYSDKRHTNTTTSPLTSLHKEPLTHTFKAEFCVA